MLYPSDMVCKDCSFALIDKLPTSILYTCTHFPFDIDTRFVGKDGEGETIHEWCPLNRERVVPKFVPKVRRNR